MERGSLLLSPFLPCSSSLECPGLCLWVYFLLGLAVSGSWGGGWEEKKGKKEWLCQQNPGAAPRVHLGATATLCRRDSPHPGAVWSPREHPPLEGRAGHAELCSVSLLQSIRAETSALQRPRTLGRHIDSFISQMRKWSQETGPDGPGYSSTDIVMVCAIYPRGMEQSLSTHSLISSASLFGGR